MKIYIQTYGCTANQAESEIMAGLLQEAGHQIVSENEADVIIINSCHVKHTTEQKILAKISKIRKPLIVAGCMPEVYSEKILAANPNASLLGTHQIAKVVGVAEDLLNGKTRIVTGPSGKEKLGFPRVRKDKNIARIQIADGCLGNCTFCATRLAKGKLFSYRPSSIIKEICSALKEGCKEIWLTAQDTGAYGKDIGVNLPMLLSLLPSGNYKLRVGMMNPNHVLPMLDELIQAYKDPKIIKFLHIPVQSGDNEILRAMRRNYTVEDFEHIINKFRKEFPQIKIWTDIIIGYPGETEEQFQRTLSLLKRVRPDKVNISRYTKRDKTPAAKLKQLDTKETKRRSKIAADLIKNFNK